MAWKPTFSVSYLLLVVILLLAQISLILWLPLGAPIRAADRPQPTSSYPSSPAPGMLRMNMKSYGNHNATYDSRILAIKPELVIDNPPHGLYGEMEENQYPGEGYTASWLLQNVAGYQAAGIKVIGYITSGYEGRGGGDS